MKNKQMKMLFRHADMFRRDLKVRGQVDKVLPNIVRDITDKFGLEFKEDIGLYASHKERASITAYTLGEALQEAFPNAKIGLKEDHRDSVKTKDWLDYPQSYRNIKGGLDSLEDTVSVAVSHEPNTRKFNVYRNLDYVIVD